MSADLARQQSAIDKAWQHSTALKRAIAEGRHACWCGAFGPFRRDSTGPWFCRAHVTFDDAGLFHPIPREVQP